ncbi:uncharacterized protein TRAVEDRAFT_136133 [Trametes versicolor FP-101664 SS1]|uniref:uncharacterized protein n=1 Tax=Trametes versicolor (strain FP-101664) TaxID=717944 RepID=UPI000462297F|nr:uncharacterized protein TRAVEDRAFT_136133 [Trametes versicolor FP-101664 SS1]EIW52228.1 hypothetical protein TRAVEDRAFT_136133 [Trametes versicolor FP-101664 SS1]
MALYTPPRHANDTLLSRDDSPADQDLLASCPGGPGSSNIAHADRCTLINIVNNPDVRLFSILGDPQLNCGGSSDDITVTLGGESTVGSETTVNANFGIDFEGISVGGGIESSTSTSQTVSKSISFTVKPGRQAVYVAGTNFHSQTGNVQVNYGSRQFGHFIWFTGTTITQLSPDSGDVEFDVHETACGTCPLALS